MITVECPVFALMAPIGEGLFKYWQDRPLYSHGKGCWWEYSYGRCFVDKMYYCPES